MKHCTKAIPQQAIDLIKKWEGLYHHPIFAQGINLQLDMGILSKKIKHMVALKGNIFLMF